MNLRDAASVLVLLAALGLSLLAFVAFVPFGVPTGMR